MMTSITIRFPTDNDMDKAFDYLINESEDGFSSIDTTAIAISKNQLEGLKRIKGLKFEQF